MSEWTVKKDTAGRQPTPTEETFMRALCTWVSSHHTPLQSGPIVGSLWGLFSAGHQLEWKENTWAILVDGEAVLLRQVPELADMLL